VGDPQEHTLFDTRLAFSCQPSATPDTNVPPEEWDFQRAIDAPTLSCSHTVGMS